MYPKVKTTLLVISYSLFKIVLASEIIAQIDKIAEESGRNDDDSSNQLARDILEYMNHLDIPLGPEKDRVLILGVTGAGSSFVSCVLANDSTLEGFYDKYQSIKIRDQKGRVGTQMITHTITPDRVVDETGNSYYDCPGFRTTLGTAHDVSVSYSIKRIICRSTGVKLVFVVDYFDVSPTGSLLTLQDLVIQATRMFEDWEQYSRSAMLIINKKPNITRKGRIETDQEFIKSIVERFDLIKQVSIKQINETKDPGIIEVNLKWIKFIDLFSFNNGSRIGVVHLVEEEGFVNKIPIFIENRSRLRQMMNEELEFYAADCKDVKPSISVQWIGDLSDMYKDIERHLQQIVSDILQHLITLETRTTDLDQLSRTFRDLYIAAKQVSSIDFHSNTVTPNGFVKKIYFRLKDFGLKEIPPVMLQPFMSDKIFNILREVNSDFTKVFKQVIEYWIEKTQFLKATKDWYEFLSSLDKVLMQRIEDIEADKLIEECGKIVNEGPWSVEEYLQQLHPFLTSVGQDKLYELVRGTNITYRQIQILKQILNTHRVNQLEIKCDQNKEMTVKGSKLTLSAVVRNECWQDADNVNIFATNMFIVDTSAIKATENCLISIFAPFWMVTHKHVIYLNGTKGKTPLQPRADKGRAGVDGTAGITGCHFSSIAGTTINAEFLSVDVTGGIGGNGQAGYNGLDGKDGKNPDIPLHEFPVDDNWFRKDFPYTLINSNMSDSDGGKLYSYYYEVMGTPGTLGEDGSDGGKPGQHSPDGYANFIFTDKTNSSRFNVIQREKGSFAGAGGTGGSGGRNGDRYFVLSTFLSAVRTQNENKVVRKDDLDYQRNGTYGHKYKDNGNNDIYLNPKIVKPYGALQEYKCFLRSILKNNYKKVMLQNFLLDVDNYPQININLTLNDFLNEYISLEKIYSDLEKEIPFDILFNPFVKRLEIFESTNNMSSDESKVFHMMHAAVLSKMIVLNGKIRPTYFNDLQVYLRQMLKKIKNTDLLERRMFIKYPYDKDLHILQEVIHRGTVIVKDRLTPETDNIFENTEGKMMESVRKIIEQENQTKQELKEEEKEVISNILNQRMFMIVNITFGTITSLTGVGSTMSALITGDWLSAGQSAKNTIENINISYDNIKKNYEYRYALVKRKARDTTNNLSEFKNDPSLNPIREILSKVVTVINDVMAEGKLVSPIKFWQLENDCSSLLIKRADEETKKSVPKTELISVLTKGAELFELGEIGLTKYQEIEFNEKILKKLHEAVINNQEALDAVRDIEEFLFNTMLPTLNETKKILQNLIVELSQRKEPIMVDLSKWKSALEDLKYAFYINSEDAQSRGMTDLQKSFEDTRRLLLQAFEKCETVRDLKRLYDYLSLVTFIEIEHNPELQDVLDNMRNVTLNNMILYEYNIVVKRLQQQVFPFASCLLSTFNLNINQTTQNVEADAEKKVIQMLEWLEENDVSKSVDKYDIIVDKEGDPQSQFFLWNHSTVNTTEIVEKLFRGGQVFLNADIKNNSLKNAVKFKDLELYFKVPANKSREEELLSHLGNFHILMTMGIKNYYRCNKDIYSIRYQEQVSLAYSPDRTRGGRARKCNLNYASIHKARGFFFSPYTKWQIALDPLSDVDNPDEEWKKLRSFQNDGIDIELRGWQQYLRRDSINSEKYCQAELKNYYYQEPDI